MMFYGGGKGETQLLKNVFEAIQIFNCDAPIGHYMDIVTNLLERVFAGLDIDLRYLRSPHDHEQGEEYRQTIRNFKYVLDQFLRL